MSSTTMGQSMRGFAVKRVAELSGGALWFFVACSLLAIASYHSGDPSLNTFTQQSAQNWLGLPGAYLADIFLQTFGLVSLILLSVFAGWGWNLLRRGKITMLNWRVMTLIVSILCGVITFARIEPTLQWPVEPGYGGAMGYIVNGYIAGASNTLVLTLAGLIGIFSWLFALGVKPYEWRAIGRLQVRAAKGVYWLIHHLKRSGDYLEFADYEDTSDESAAPLKPKSVSKRKTVKPSAKAERKTTNTTQSSLKLGAKHGDYAMPDTAFLSLPKVSKKKGLSEQALAQNAKLLESVLQDFGVKGDIINIKPGPVVTLYELEPAAGTKSSRVIGLADDIARSMSAISARIAVVPGRNVIGIELPNQQRETVYLREVLEEEDYQETDCKLPLALGKDIAGDSEVVDLAKMPHLLVAGTTGSGKSVAINTMIMSLVYHLPPEQCKFIMIDPKMLELSIYDGIPHLLTPVVTEPGKAVVALKWTVKEMEERYKLMASVGVRNIDGYNQRIKQAKAKGEELTRTAQTGYDRETGKPIYEEQAIELETLPYIVVIVDEMADLMLVAGKDIEGSIQRLAQMARAAGIHLIMATQRPSVDVITGVIKANFPTRISFQVTSKIDSRTILGEQGAEQLLGQGDMLYMAGGGRVTRVHGPFVSDSEVEEIVTYLKSQGEPTYIEDVTVDTSEDDPLALDDDDDVDKELYDRAVAIVARDGKASTSYVQRCLKIGYNRAARLIDKMERDGVIGPANHVGKREVLVGEV